MPKNKKTRALSLNSPQLLGLEINFKTPERRKDPSLNFSGNRNIRKISKTFQEKEPRPLAPKGVLRDRQLTEERDKRREKKQSIKLARCSLQKPKRLEAERGREFLVEQSDVAGRLHQHADEGGLVTRRVSRKSARCVDGEQEEGGLECYRATQPSAFTSTRLVSPAQVDAARTSRSASEGCIVRCAIGGLVGSAERVALGEPNKVVIREQKSEM